MAIEIVDLPMNNGDSPTFFVCLPSYDAVPFPSTTHSGITTIEITML